MTTDAAELPTTADRRRLLVDLASSYALSVARVGANAIVVGILYRHTTAAWVAVYLVMRSMLAIAGYLLSGLGPATLRELNRPRSLPTEVPILTAAPVDDGSNVLSYATPAIPRVGALDDRPSSRGGNALVASLALAIPTVVLSVFYAANFKSLHAVGLPSGYGDWLINGILGYALGVILRAAADPAGAAMLRARRLWLDNVVLIVGECAFITFALAGIDAKYGRTFEGIGTAFLISGLLTFLARWFLAAAIRFDGVERSPRIDGAIIGRIAGGSLVLSVGAFADFLYAPANILLIDQRLGSAPLAAYGPALQIDGALLLLVSALAPVVMPRVAEAIGRNDRATARRTYLAATIAGFGLLAAGAAAMLTLSGPVLRLWLGVVPAETLAVLPFVLLHTVIGGTAGVGRATLLAMGRFRAYTISAIVGGVANVALALLFVVGLGWGLRGVALATVVAVFGRCALWMPWYVLRALRDDRLIEPIKPIAVRSDPNVGQVP